MIGRSRLAALITLVLVAVLGAGLLAGCTSSEDDQPDGPAPDRCADQ